ncbi:cytochrome o ubiquinol oxidase subunit IV [Pseudoalteromonas sp. CO302Y]|jgi:cytochrome o ubiquinol oxidase operon protein cyoD|uniref:cytochrome o ubiquinol oxidase subunit IV n=1 Tax=unclassified Pseudoalteromonas TaxID=194690 RepID=UPI00102375AE|nr:cytochrome o ubiquinol oxidase subunit IV [Pseudoalteromonas sp. CO302Y]RZG08469.1 cytochrome o ubiquinol oxidase subunit IV [Pseudoalteromonas sp. CO133X]
MSHSESHVINNLEVHAHSAQSHGSIKDYLVGFVLSVILTAIPFWAVISGSFSKPATVWCIVTMAVVQIWVHLKYFLHLSFKTEDGKASSLSFIFSAIIIVMVVGLSVWIIYESNAMMMY